MAGTKAGGLAAAKTNKAKYGDDFYSKIGAKGGSWEGVKGFALMDRKKHIKASKKGGQISRRTSSRHLEN